MRVHFAHIRERSTDGGFIDFAVFDTRSASGSDEDNGILLMQLTHAAVNAGFKVDQSALAFKHGNRIRYYGTPNLCSYLSKAGVPQMTHWIEA